MASGPPPAAGPVTFRALRSSSYDLPEDFLMRLEPGIDAETRASPERGVRVVRRLRRLREWSFCLLILAVGTMGLGTFVLVGGAALRELGVWAVLAGVGLGVAAIGCLLVFVLECIGFRKDVRRVLAFARVMRGSSLARDIG